MELGISNHLDSRGKVLLGSYYTPRKYVEAVAGWLKDSIEKGETILDPSCGYGAFFALEEFFPEARYIGNDIDGEAVRQAQANFPLVEFHCFSALKDVSREKYGIRKSDRLTIVGNPPYNDTTSLIGKTLKKLSESGMDPDIRTRDLGMSSLLAYDKLEADRVAVLHPLSYLIKRTNHRTCGRFFRNYSLKEHIVFSSQEFAGTSRTTGFPVMVALYERNPGKGIAYDDVLKTRFHTVEGDEFCLSEMEFITDLVRKYPNGAGAPPSFSGFYFYTLRDINALRRCRTFLCGRCSNAIAISLEQLPYYHYIDAFKHLVQAPYWAGNLNVPFQQKGFPEIAGIAERYSRSLHPEIFGHCIPPSEEEVHTLKSYIDSSLGKGKS
ncbi:MAG: N-6 DNA methylase [Oligosphaeraceae bacterium]